MREVPFKCDSQQEWNSPELWTEHRHPTAYRNPCVSSSSQKTTGDVQRRRKNRNGRKDMRGNGMGKGFVEREEGRKEWDGNESLTQRQNRIEMNE